MPFIMQDEQQVNAQNEISTALESIKSLNTLIAPGKDGSYQVAFVPEKGRSTKLDVSASDIIPLLTKQRARLVKDVKSKASKFRIGLDDSDRACLEDIAAPEEPEQMTMDTVQQEDAPQENVTEVNVPAAEGEGEHQLSEEEELERMIAEEEAAKQTQQGGDDQQNGWN